MRGSTECGWRGRAWKWGRRAMEAGIARACFGHPVALQQLLPGRSLPRRRHSATLPTTAIHASAMAFVVKSPKLVWIQVFQCAMGPPRTAAPAQSLGSKHRRNTGGPPRLPAVHERHWARCAAADGQAQRRGRRARRLLLRLRHGIVDLRRAAQAPEILSRSCRDHVEILSRSCRAGSRMRPAQRLN